MIAQELVDATRRRLRGGVATGEQLNTLKTDYTSGSGVLAFSNSLQGIQAGTRISAGLNIFHIVSVSPTSNTAKVISGIDGSNDDNLAAGTLVRVKPRWTDFEIFNALNDDITDLSSPVNGLFQVLDTEVTFNPVVRGYDLGGLSMIRVLDVRWQTIGPWKDWPRVNMYRLERRAPTSDFPSGLAIRIDEGGFPGRPVQVVYAAPFTALGILSDDVAATGLPATAFRLPPLGAAVQLQTGVDIERTRTDSQPNTVKMADVPAQTPGLAVRAIAQLRQQWINDEAMALMAQWPPKMKAR